jgi:hypothetical protein
MRVLRRSEVVDVLARLESPVFPLLTQLCSVALQARSLLMRESAMESQA